MFCCSDFRAPGRQAKAPPGQSPLSLRATALQQQQCGGGEVLSCHALYVLWHTHAGACVRLLPRAVGRHLPVPYGLSATRGFGCSRGEGGGSSPAMYPAAAAPQAGGTGRKGNGTAARTASASGVAGSAATSGAAAAGGQAEARKAGPLACPLRGCGGSLELVRLVPDNWLPVLQRLRQVRAGAWTHARSSSIV